MIMPSTLNWLNNHPQKFFLFEVLMTKTVYKDRMAQSLNCLGMAWLLFLLAHNYNIFNRNAILWCSLFHFCCFSIQNFEIHIMKRPTAKPRFTSTFCTGETPTTPAKRACTLVLTLIIINHSSGQTTTNQKTRKSTVPTYNIAYEQKGLSSFSNIHFFNKLLYFYQADELWIPFQLIGKYR